MEILRHSEETFSVSKTISCQTDSKPYLRLSGDFTWLSDKLCRFCCSGFLTMPGSTRFLCSPPPACCVTQCGDPCRNMECRDGMLLLSAEPGAISEHELLPSSKTVSIPIPNQSGFIPPHPCGRGQFFNGNTVDSRHWKLSWLPGAHRNSLTHRR